MNNISVYGATGFVGKTFVEMFPSESVVIRKHQRRPQTSRILYLISTTDNYNVYTDPHIDVDTNITILLDVLEECRIRKESGENIEFNFISSWFVYGDTECPAKETSYCDPKGFYSITKRTAEQLIESYCKVFDIPYRIIRLCNVTGAGDKKAGKRKNVLSYLVKQLKENNRIDLYNGGQFVRDYLHVKDVCRGIKLILDKGELDDVYNIGSGVPRLFQDIIYEAKELIGSTSIIESIPQPLFHKIVQVKSMWLDTTKVKALGFEPQISYTEILKELVNENSNDH